MASRNQREGRFIPGWCYNPDYKAVQVRPGVMKAVQKKRAGAHFNLIRVRNFNDMGHIIPGLTYVRTYREGAFE